eukprot:SAG31_NODE_4664_length_3056_cov_3.064592_5_plen_80_part_00
MTANATNEVAVTCSQRLVYVLQKTLAFRKVHTGVISCLVRGGDPTAARQPANVIMEESQEGGGNQMNLNAGSVPSAACL